MPDHARLSVVPSMADLLADPEKGLDVAPSEAVMPARHPRLGHHQAKRLALVEHEHCEVCSWRPPYRSMLHIHHIVPVRVGGGHKSANLIVLCPNCHALAHQIMSYYFIRESWGRDELFKALIEAAAKTLRIDAGEVFGRVQDALIRRLEAASERRYHRLARAERDQAFRDLAAERGITTLELAMSLAATGRGEGGPRV